MSGYRLGVDYGTSHTVAVLAGPDGRTRPLLFDGTPLLPSAVAADGDGHLLTGAEALRTARVAPASIEPNPKRRITDGDVLLDGRSHPVVALISATLRTVAEEAARVAGEMPRITVTHPAGWGASRRGVLAAAIADAGYDTAVYLPEPVAAARFFTALPGGGVAVGAHIVVYDLGAGTCDVAVLRRTADGFDVVGVGGLDDVGGLDLDAVVVDILGRAVGGTEEWRRLLDGDPGTNPRHRHALWQDVRAAKESLSRRSSALVHVPVLDRDLPVSREDFEATARPVLDRTIALTRNVIASSGLAPGAVAGLYLVGGASRVPLVATMLHQATGIAPTALDQPELAVAEGAAMAPVVASPRAPAPSPAPAPPPVAPPPPAAWQPPAVPARQAPAPPAVEAPSEETWFHFKPSQDLVNRRRLLRGAIVVAGALPLLFGEFLAKDMGLAPYTTAVVLLVPLAVAAGIAWSVLRDITDSSVLVHSEGVTIRRKRRTAVYPWKRVTHMRVDDGRLVMFLSEPFERIVVGTVAWLRLDAPRLAASVRHFSSGRFDPRI
ncbi:Hsp70 family protein [Phytomonospora sp. NPDC050363]|uniref:Hsp70 family protein n=1 Tax=Phytomonospora sp. NPDC050363 TaxID=3155642 RepID=UPI0033CDBF85